MKKILLILFALNIGIISSAQTPQKVKRSIFRDTTVVPDNEIVYPIKGSMIVTPTEMTQFRKIEFWIHDATGKELYYSNHSMPIDINDPTNFYVRMDREYGKLMRKYSRRMSKM